VHLFSRLRKSARGTHTVFQALEEG
jgi:hypothetical protein